MLHIFDFYFMKMVFQRLLLEGWRQRLRTYSVSVAFQMLFHFMLMIFLSAGSFPPYHR